MKRFQKLMKLLSQPSYWPALARGVAAGVEHEAAFVGREYATVIDIGANKGQFATFARARWPQARLICFEPLPGPRKKLKAVTSGFAEIHAIALGEYEGKAEMHIASREDSSSLLPLGETQKKLFGMEEAKRVMVDVFRLDTVIAANKLFKKSLLKIDVQGFEYESLVGAAELLSHIDTVYVETSYVELYSGQKLASDVAAYLGDFGFEAIDKFNLYQDGTHDIQADILFEKKNS